MANTKVTHTGTVVKAGKELVSVKIEVRSACSACHAKSMCAAHDMAEKIIEAVPMEEVAEGDPVVVEMEEKFGLKAVFYVFSFHLYLWFRRFSSLRTLFRRKL